MNLPCFVVLRRDCLGFATDRRTVAGKKRLDLALAAAELRVSARDQETAPEGFTVATFVPPQADIGRLQKR